MEATGNFVVEKLRQLPPEALRINNGNVFDLRAQERPYIRDISSGELVVKPSESKGEAGQFFVKMPEVAANIFPGSVIQPEEFLSGIEFEGNIDAAADELLSGNVSTDISKPTLEHAEDGFKLRVMNGTFNEGAIRLSELASELFDINQELKNTKASIVEITAKIAAEKEKSWLKRKSTEHMELELQQKKLAQKALEDSLFPKRGDYQQIAYDMYKPMLDVELDKKASEESEFDVDVWEDCLATADTVAGIFAALKLKSSIKSMQGARIKARVNVITATAQGIMYLRQFAKQNDIDLEINTAQVAWGLSAGVPTEVDVDGKVHNINAHANYLVHPREILARIENKFPNIFKRLRLLGEEPFAVGDMGDNFESMPQEYDARFPWNLWRTDGHGHRVIGKGLDENTHGEIANNGFYDHNLNPKIFLRNGGYVLQAFYQYAKDLRRPLGTLREMHDKSHLSFSAKRVMALDENTQEAVFGVLLYGLHPNVLPN